MDESADDLADAVEDLTRTLEELTTEVEPRPRPKPRLRPPTPREVLEFTDEVALPALIAILEANLRTLEAAQRGLSMLRTERAGRQRATEASERVTTLQETTLDQLDGALADLQEALAGGSPRDDRAQELIQEARQLRTEVDKRLRDAVESDPEDGGRASETEATEPEDGARRIEIEDDSDDDTDVDVDAELETLKDEYASDDDDDTEDGDESDG